MGMAGNVTVNCERRGAQGLRKERSLSDTGVGFRTLSCFQIWAPWRTVLENPPFFLQPFSSSVQRAGQELSEIIPQSPGRGVAHIRLCVTAWISVLVTAPTAVRPGRCHAVLSRWQRPGPHSRPGASFTKGTGARCLLLIHGA